MHRLHTNPYLPIAFLHLDSFSDGVGLLFGSGSNSRITKKRKSDQMEEEHLKEVQKIKDGHLKERNKIKRQQDREVKHLNLKHNVKIQEAKLEEAKKELEDFEAEGTAD